MDLNKIIFRNASTSDIQSIINIEHSSFSKVICETEDVFIERIKLFSDGFRIMEFDNKVIGYICSEIWDYLDEITAQAFTLGHSINEQHNPSGEEVYISSMGLLPAYRGKGLGKLMFEDFTRHIKSKFPEIKSIILIVSEKWTNARKIYENNGYKEVEVIKNFFRYQEQIEYFEDGIIMRKELV